MGIVIFEIMIHKKMANINKSSQLGLVFRRANRQPISGKHNYEEIVVYDFGNLKYQENSTDNCFGCDTCNCNCDCDSDNADSNDYCDSDW